MESIIDLITVVSQLLDVDFSLQISEVWGEFSQTILIGLAWLLTALNSHPFGCGCLAHLHNPGLLGLDHIVLPLEKISTNSLRCSHSRLTNPVTRTRFPIAASLSFHLNC
jgi:hypothetical protein